jgi:hypothetical protein
MAITLSIFGVSFAAFCIWLVVRIVNRRERWAKWTLAVVAVAPVIYLLTYGVAVRYDRRQLLPAWTRPVGERAFAPIYWLLSNGPMPVRSSLAAYSRLWAD